MRSLWLLCLSTIISSLLHAQTTLDTLRHLNVKPGGDYSAIWGYTAANGREYALLGCNGSGGQLPGTSFIDITDLANVRQVGFVSGPASSWREMKVYRQNAYIFTEAPGSGTQIVDLSYLPDSVHLVRTFVYTQGAKNTAKSHSITIADGFMYLNGCANWGTQQQRGVVMFDLRSDPTNPVFLGEYSPAYFHDCYVLRDTLYGSAIYADTLTAGLWIADVRNKSNPQTIGRIRYTGSGTHNAWVTKDRRFVITTDEVGTTPKTLKMWNISNLPAIPTSPAMTFTPNPTDIEHNIIIRGDYAYVAWYTAGLRVVKIGTSPDTLLNAGGYDTSTQPPGNYAGMWGVYPYFPSGKIVGGDMQNGLWVFRFSDLAARLPVTLLNPAMNETTLTATPLTFRWTKSANLSKDPHWYDLRLTGAGLDTTWRANDSVTVFTATGNLQMGSPYTWYITTRDEFNTTRSPQTFQFSYGAPAAITVTAPNGGENWQLGTSHAIQWNSSSVPGNVKVEYSSNGGANYGTLFANTTNDGSEQWVVTGPPTSNALVRISSVGNPSVTDVSNSSFTVTGAGFAVLAKLILRDNGGETDSMEFGAGAGATDGIDPLFGEFEQPPLPPLGVFDVRWRITGTQGTKRDIRDTLGGTRRQIIYTGQLQSGAGGYPFHLRWNRTELPGGTFTLRDGPGGTSFLVNMKQADSLVIKDAGIATFQLVYDADAVVYANVEQNWNVVSVPMVLSNLSKSSVFPTSNSNAFAYTPGGYQSHDTLSYGVGYWLKFPSAQTVSVSGGPISTDTLDVLQGWNIVGSISTPVPVSGIVQIPAGIVSSAYFGFSSGMYVTSPTIIPMRGYWIKVNQNGKLVLPGSAAREHPAKTIQK